MTEEPISKSSLLNLLVHRNPQLPQQVSRLGGEMVLEMIADSLSAGRVVSLRGFGRLIPRYYDQSTTKKLGLIFRPSPQLVRRLNAAQIVLEQET
jgi:nucleoid DNA-binding protein